MLRDVRTCLLKKSSLASGAITGTHWRVLIGEAAGAATLREQESARAEDERAAILASPLVAAAFQAFPDAELVEWKKVER